MSPFVPSAPFLYPRNNQKTVRFSNVFRGVEKGCIGNKWVKGYEKTTIVVEETSKINHEYDFIKMM